MRTLILKIIILSGISFILPLEAMKKQPQKTSRYIPIYAQRVALIFLDNSETKNDPITIHLLEAIKHKACPLIVSESVLANLFSGYTKKEKYIQENTQELVEFFNKEFDKNSEKMNQEDVKKCLTIGLIASEFNPQEWIIKKTINGDHTYYILIPNSYLLTIDKNINLKKDTLFDPQIKELSNIETQLGLKINHLLDSSLSEITAVNESKIGTLEEADPFPSTLAQIFCTRSEYLKIKAPTRALWSFYIIGHGKYKQSIVSLDPYDFLWMLRVLDRDIHTQALIYISCYGAGATTYNIYQNSNSPLQNTYPFVLITSAPTDATVALDLNLKVVAKNNRMTLETSTNFTELISKLTQDPADYEGAIKNIPLVKAQSSPQIKLPGIPWFSVMGNRQEIVSIGSNLAKTRDKELDITPTSPHGLAEQKTLLLYAADIPFPLKINPQNEFRIISMIPGDALHRIKSISTKKNENKVLSWFMSIRNIEAHKIFYIETINIDDKNDKTTLRDAIIVYEKIYGQDEKDDHIKCTAFFEYNDTIYIKKGPSKTIAICPEHKKKTYYNLISLIRVTYPLKNFKITREEDLFNELPLLGKTTFIENIDVKNITISLLFTFFYGELKKIDKSFLWIKKLTVPNKKESMFGVPGAADGSIITLTDVILDSTKEHKAYYTYNGQKFSAQKTIDFDYTKNYKLSPYSLVSEQLPGSLLPSSITQEGIEKIKAIITPEHRKKIQEGLKK